MAASLALIFLGVYALKTNKTLKTKKLYLLT